MRLFRLQQRHRKLFGKTMIVYTRFNGVFAGDATTLISYFLQECVDENSDSPAWLTLTTDELLAITGIRSYWRLLNAKKELAEQEILEIKNDALAHKMSYRLNFDKLHIALDRFKEKDEELSRVAHDARNNNNDTIATKKNIYPTKSRELKNLKVGNTDETLSSTTPETFDSDEYIKEKLIGVKDKRKDLWLIGKFAKFKKIKFANGKHVQAFISQHIRAARLLQEYPDADIQWAAVYCERKYVKDRIAKGEEPFPWNLHTMGKALSSGVKTVDQSTS